MSRFVNIMKKVWAKGPQLLEGSSLYKAKNLIYYANHKDDWNTKNDYILVESKHGQDMAGNMLKILMELNADPKYKDYHIIVPYAKEKKEYIKGSLETYNLTNIHLVRFCSKEYFKAVTEAKYWFNDTTFLTNIVKKPEQIYLNTWHGTPLKRMGRPSETNRVELGNVQRNFMMSDYIIWPNEFTKEKMTEGYMLDNVCTSSNAVVTGYPRNDFFLNPLDLDLKGITHGKKIYMYLPTWRPEKDRTSEILDRLDDMLSDEEVLVVKLHPLQKGSIDLSSYKHIQDVPSGYALYHVLSHCDALITDYSSVMFDYAHNANASIILYPYDKELYTGTRGLYRDIESLGLPVVADEIELYKKLQELPLVPDSFKEEFCMLGSKNYTKQILNSVFDKENSSLVYEPIQTNFKPVMLIHGGNLDKNGVTSSLLNFINYLSERNDYNVIVSFKTSLAKKNGYVIEKFPDNISYIARTGRMNLSLMEHLIFMQYTLLSLFPNKVKQIIEDNTEAEFERLYPGLKFDTVVQFSGYSDQELYQYLKISARNHIVFVHNDMMKEIETRGNQHKEVLQYVYPRYDKVALVSSELKGATSYFTQGSKKNFYEVLNMINYNEIRAMGDLDIEDEVIKSSVDDLRVKCDQLFITVGRYSKEKGHDRLISAFKQLQNLNKDKNLGLIIIGGCGEDYNKTVALANTGENILCLKGMQNPQPVMRMCDCFVLSSWYEGQPMVFAEADIQGLPVISTDVPGCHKLLSKYGGYLCANSEEGLVEAMQSYLEGYVKPMNMDYEAYNQISKDEIDELLK